MPKPSLPYEGIDPEALLRDIRAEDRPLIQIHTGQIEDIRESAPMTSMANDYVKGWLDDPDHKADPGMSAAEMEADYLETAEMVHSMGWKYTESDTEAFELLRRCISKGALAGHPGAKNFLPHLMASDAFNAFSWYGKWYHYGCQSIEVEDKYAGSLCATKVAPSELEYVQLPWPCFIVRAPKFLQRLLVNGEPLRHIVVQRVRYGGTKAKVVGKQQIDAMTLDMHDQYFLQLITPNKYRLLPASSLAQWAEPDPSRSYDFLNLKEVEYRPTDIRQLEVIGRLVLGAMIAMNDDKAHRRYGTLAPGKKPSIGSPRYGTPDQVILHKIGKPVKVDARETIAAYVSGKTGHVTNVRTLVAGHWKNQPHGPKSTLRRWQHIECYWRGDEDAPRIIRPHVLTGGE